MKLRVRQAIYVLLAIAAFVLLIVVVTNSQSPESLMNPPEAAGDYKDIQDVIEKSVGNGIILKAPNEGDYTTAITFFDFTADSENDAVAFYRIKNDDTSAIYMSVLIKNGSKWSASDPVKGQGNDILEFACGDLDYDSVPDIAVGWSMFDSKDNNSLCVYSVKYEDSKTSVTENDSLIYTKMSVADICSEGRNEILLVKNTYNDESAPAAAYVYELEDGSLKQLSKTSLVSSVSEYKKIQVQKVDSKNVFFLDGIIGQSSMITEILYWDSESGKLANPTAADVDSIPTLRKGTVASLDINDDGVIEIPFAAEEYSPEYIELTDWQQFTFDGFINVGQGVCTDELIFNFPESWKDNIALSKKGNVWSFYDISGYEKDKLFDLVASDISGWQALSEDYDKLKIDYGTIYGVKLTSSKSKLALTKNEIKDLIINIR